MLVAREVPPFGGDTMFANMYAAYEALSPGMQRLLDGLRAVNSSALADVSKTREDRIRDSGGERRAASTSPSTRSCARTRRPGARRCTSTSRTRVRFVDMTEDESRPLLRFLFEHSVRPEFTCRFRWQVGLARAVGQPLRDAQPDQRLPRLHPPDAPHHPRRRRSPLTRPLQALSPA